MAVRWPVAAKPRTQILQRLDVEVVEKYRASGDGWKTRINDALKSWVRTNA